MLIIFSLGKWGERWEELAAKIVEDVRKNHAVLTIQSQGSECNA